MYLNMYMSFTFFKLKPKYKYTTILHKIIRTGKIIMRIEFYQLIENISRLGIKPRSLIYTVPKFKIQGLAKNEHSSLR